MANFLDGQLHQDWFYLRLRAIPATIYWSEDVIQKRRNDNSIARTDGVYRTGEERFPGKSVLRQSLAIRIHILVFFNISHLGFKHLSCFEETSLNPACLVVPPVL
jgi:hypothetical protein